MGRPVCSHDEQMSPQWAKALAALHGAAFAEYLRSCRWFGGKAQTLRGVQVLEVLSLGDVGQMILLQADYLEVPSEIYLLPMQLAVEGAVFVDALEDEHFRAALLEIIAGEQRLSCGSGELVGICGAEFKSLAKGMKQPPPSRVLTVEQSNSSILYDGRYFLKLYRRPEVGENPDVELLRYFSEGHKFASVPGYCGVIEYRAQGSKPRVLALLVMNVPHEGTAWTATLRRLAQSREANGVIGIERARLLGERTAQMHLALAADTGAADFAPEAFTASYRDSLRHSMATATQSMMQLLEQKVDTLPVNLHMEAVGLLRREQEILQRHAGLLEHPIKATRIRIHGDYHLGQVLDTGNDFIIIDFEGEPARPLDERRSKHSPLRDVAGMLRSFDYAAHTAAHPEAWVERISREFLNGYLAVVEGASFLPANEEELNMLLEACLLEKAVYEVCYELNNRPDWVAIPLRGITRILDRSAGR